MTAANDSTPLYAASAGWQRKLDTEAGSAYIITLLVLAVLALGGVSVTLVTQTEFLIGGAERMINRVFYAADSGIAASTARALVSADFGAATIEIPEPNSPPALNLRHSVELTPFYPTLEAPCNLCEINNIGTYAERSYRAVNFVITATSTRVGGAGNSPLAQGTVGAMIEVQPWKPATEAYLPIDDATELEKIKF